MSELDNCKWQRAAHAFARCAERGGEDASGALYWKAYAENRSGNPEQALATLAAFEKKFPSCNWSKEARTLRVEIQSKGRTSTRGATEPDAHLKLILLDKVMRSSVPEALPSIRAILWGDASPGIKERALFLLAANNSVQARNLIRQVASSSSDDNVRLRAIEYTGIIEGEQSRKQLMAKYREDVSASKVLVSALRPSGSQANSERLWQLFHSADSTTRKQSVLNTMLLLGDAEPLLRVASSNADASLRVYAIHALAVVKNGAQAQRLAALFRNDKDPQIRNAVLQSLCMLKDEKTLRSLARMESDAAVRDRINSFLSSSFSVTNISSTPPAPVQ